MTLKFNIAINSIENINLCTSILSEYIGLDYDVQSSLDPFTFTPIVYITFAGFISEDLEIEFYLKFGHLLSK